MILMVFVIMLVLFALGVPVAWSMAMAASAYMAFGPHIGLHGMVQRMVGGLDSFPLLAVPFFILAGNLMNTGGITDRLVSFARVMVGRITGGLAHTVVVTNMIMAGMSGSAVADAAGTGTILVPAMKKAGYDVPFAAAIVGAAATIGPIIPPSIPFVIYGSMAGVSIGRLFLAGAIPGVLMGVVLMVFAYVIARKRHYPQEQQASCGQMMRAFISALPPLGMPVIVLGGIIGGVMTPTEAAVVAAMYAFFLGFVVYREIKVSQLPALFLESAITAGSIAIIVSAASPIGWVLTLEQAPAKLMSLISAADLNAWQLLLAINVALLVLGCLMDGMAIMIMVIPLLMPILGPMGIDPVHFGVLFAINIMIGTITPPVGITMYIMCGIGKISTGQFAREVWPFVVALVIALGLVTYIPDIALWLPNQLMGVSR